MLTVKTGPDALYLAGKDFTRIYDFQSMKIYDLNLQLSRTLSAHFMLI